MKRFFLQVLIVAAFQYTGSNAQSSLKADLLIDRKGTLSEGAIWDNRNGILLFIDIEEGKYFEYRPDNRGLKETRLGQKVGTVVPAVNGSVILALQKGMYALNRKDGSLRFLISNPEANLKDNRFNDGKCDPGGRLWIGTMSMLYAKGKGSLYRLDQKGVFTKMISGVTISNGIAWTADRKKMYYIDTPTGTVRGFAYDDRTGNIDTGQVVIRISHEMGSPDGMTIDAEGKLWIALYGGFAVRRWDPQTGKMIFTVEVAAKNVTSCTFGGSDLDILYITTARQGNSPEELAKYPASGGVFSCKTGFKGLPANYFGEQESEKK